jgi:hypothetical protein
MLCWPRIILITIIIIFDSSIDRQSVIERFRKLSVWRPTVMLEVSLLYAESLSERMLGLYLPLIKIMCNLPHPIIIIIIIIIINCKWVCTRWQWYYNTQYNTQKTKQRIHTQNDTQRNNYKHNNTKLQTQCTKGNRSIKKYDKRNIHMYNYHNMI